MDKKLIPIAVTATLCLAACSNDEVMEKNLDPRGNAIAFSAKVGHSTRATETTIGNLGDFYVFGKSVHPTGSLYSAYLVGSESGSTATPETAKRKDEPSGGTTTASWSLEREVYLPNGITNAVFWAFADGKKGDGTILSSGTVKFDHLTGPQIAGYKSGKADLKDATPTVWTDGNAQRDLVSAFGQAKGDGSLSHIIKLNFNHMLSEVIIKASQKGKSNNDHRVVKVKGAWIVNVNSQADLSAGYNAGGQTDNPVWSSFAEPGQFGSYFTDPVDLSGKLGDGNDGWADLTTYNSNPLMLIPQTVPAWTPDPSSSFKTTTTAAYIMLLCRVELKHAGDQHEGATVTDPDIHVEGGFHYHQQFPVSSKYDSKEYGLTCIPVNISWERGKRYTCYLDICGVASGAGIYPPAYDPDEIKNLIVPDSEKENITITPIPTDKNPGDPVLDAPIKFAVTVGAWEDGEWTNGGEFPAN